MDDRHYLAVCPGHAQRIVHTAGRFRKPEDVVLAWDLVILPTLKGDVDLHCDHCVSNVRSLSAPDRSGVIVVVEHDPACPWIRADPPFDADTEARRARAQWS
jgi:hypothetical protein